MSVIDCVHSIEGSGPPIFMVHGIGSRRSGWDGVVASLKDDFTCISYDLRGHGDSPLPVGEFGLDDLVDDLAALQEKLGIDKAHVIGHSLGGMIGPAYALRHPDRVLTLGLLSTAAGRTDEDSSKVQGVVHKMEEVGIANILPTLIDRWFTDAFLKANPDKIEARLQQVLDTPAEVFLNVFHIYAETEMAPWLHRISTPSLVLTGENDGGCNPRLNKFIASELQDSELVILDELKHSILIEAPDAVADHVRRFIHGNSGS